MLQIKDPTAFQLSRLCVGQYVRHRSSHGCRFLFDDQLKDLEVTVAQDRLVIEFAKRLLISGAPRNAGSFAEIVKIEIPLGVIERVEVVFDQTMSITTWSRASVFYGEQAMDRKSVKYTAMDETSSIINDGSMEQGLLYARCWTLTFINPKDFETLRQAIWGHVQCWVVDEPAQ